MQKTGKKYKIIFSGKLLPGRNPQAATQQVRKHFPNGDRLVALVTGKRAAVLKKNTSLETARKIKALGEQCGIVLVIQPMEAGIAALQNAAPSASGKKPPVNPQEMATCPWCGHWQAVSKDCGRCRKPLSGARNALSALRQPVNHSNTGVPKSKKSFREKFRSFRIAVLLLILAAVGLTTWHNERDATDWKESLHVVVYPINGDDSPDIAAFIGTLDDGSFDVVENFFQAQAASYGVELAEPFIFSLAPEVKAQPPEPPRSGGKLDIVWWSLKLRYWVFTSDTYKDQSISPSIRVFVVYHEATGNRTLQESLGLKKSRTGIVHAFADYQMAGQNKVVIAHEVMHTLGATDKYSMQTLKPDFPDGFAAPQQKPLYPQTRAEIMGSRIPVTDRKWEMPPSLDFVAIGEKTAAEIRWVSLPD